MIPTMSPRPIVEPPTDPTPTAAGLIMPRARKGLGRWGGSVVGGAVSYADVYAFAWWYGGGWLTLNRGKKGLRRVHRGSEDVNQIQQ